MLVRTTAASRLFWCRGGIFAASAHSVFGRQRERVGHRVVDAGPQPVDGPVPRARNSLPLGKYGLEFFVVQHELIVGEPLIQQGPTPADDLAVHVVFRPDFVG
jgi:hypothetical protein